MSMYSRLMSSQLAAWTGDGASPKSRESQARLNRTR